jgi:prepilin-type N-terminal cleavage/methylation domain-containing protein
MIRRHSDPAWYNGGSRVSNKPPYRTRWPRRSAKNTGAFTLIEVLVVVAIIALLVAILIPSLSKARHQAKAVACRANLHDLGIAFTMYAEAYRGYFPLTAGSGSDSFYALGSRGSDPNGRWKSNYLKNLSILICPATRNRIRPETLNWPVQYDSYAEDSGGISDPIPFMSPNKSGDPPSDIDDAAPKGRDDSSGGHSYEYNGCYDSALKDPTTGKPVHPLSNHHKRSTDSLFPANQMVLVHDNDDRFTGSDLACEDSRWGENNCPQPWDNHGADGMNMMFGDGHADWAKKLSGTYIDFTDPGRPARPSKNASIDRIFLKSQYPWEYASRWRQ